MKAITYSQLEVGNQLETLVKPPISRVQLAQYAGASGDFNPLHLDDDFAKGIGVDGAIAHGMLVMGFLGEYVMGLAGKRGKLTNFRMRFGGMTFPGDVIHCIGTVVKLYEKDGQKYASLELKAEKSTGETVGMGGAELQYDA